VCNTFQPVEKVLAELVRMLEVGSSWSRSGLVVRNKRARKGKEAARCKRHAAKERDVIDKEGARAM
jgi:hypothetical protein